MSFILPAIAGITALGSWASGKGKANAQNKQNTYETDQKRRDYEAQRAMAQEQDQRKLDGIDFLQAVAQGKGYNIPAGAFEALKRRGAYAGMSATDRIADAPKQGSSVWGALGTGLTTYADLAAKSALGPAAPPIKSTSSPQWDGTSANNDIGNQSIVDYYLSLLKQTPQTANGEISINPGDTGSVRVGG